MLGGEVRPGERENREGGPGGRRERKGRQPKGGGGRKNKTVGEFEGKGEMGRP